MRNLLYLWALSAASALAGEIITVDDFDNRSLGAEVDLWDASQNVGFGDSDQTAPFHDGSWEFGILAEQFHAFGQAIAVAGQNTYVADGSATIQPIS